MLCMGRSYCPVRIFPLWAIVCMHSNKGSNKVVKMIGYFPPVTSTGCIKKVDNFETALNLAKRLEL